MHIIRFILRKWTRLCQFLCKIRIKNTKVNLYREIAAINISYKEYEKDKLTGKKMTGELQDITDKLSQLLTKLQK
jgi:septation ring formation regulator EzrA